MTRRPVYNLFETLVSHFQGGGNQAHHIRRAHIGKIVEHIEKKEGEVQFVAAIRQKYNPLLNF